jgi:hypothetical protein
VSAFYWSSSTYVTDTTGAWGVGFFDGHVYADYKFYAAYVRAVRSVTPPCAGCGS